MYIYIYILVFPLADTWCDIGFYITLVSKGSCVNDALLYIDLEEPQTPSHDPGFILALYAIGIGVGSIMRGYTAFQIVKNISRDSSSWHTSVQNTMDNDLVSAINNVGGFVEDCFGFFAALVLSQSLWADRKSVV